MLATPLQILRTHGVVTLASRGLGMAMARDSIYVGGMLGATPICHRWLISHAGSDGGSSSVSAGREALASLVASMLGGIFGALLSHPLDVAKTCMQGDLQRLRYGGNIESLMTLAREGGASRLYTGAAWRTVNITATVWIANECSLRLPKYFATV